MLRRPSAFNLIALAAVVALSLFSGWQQRRNAALDAELKARRANIAVLQQHIAITDKLYRGQKDTVVIRVTKWRTLVDSLTAPDSLAPVPMEPLTLREGIIIATAESTITSCVAVVLTCETRVAQRDSVIDSLNVQVKTAEKKSKGKVSLSTAAIAAAVAGLLGAILD